jgi:hypothetical protein
MGAGENCGCTFCEGERAVLVLIAWTVSMSMSILPKQGFITTNIQRSMMSAKKTMGKHHVGKEAKGRTRHADAEEVSAARHKHMKGKKTGERER